MCCGGCGEEHFRLRPTRLEIADRKGSDVIMSVYVMQKKPTAQIAHLDFVNANANPQKPNELFFADAQLI